MANLQVGKKELTTSSDHCLVVDGVTLRELKVQTLLNNDQDLDSPTKNELYHQRWIGDQTYAVRQVVDDDLTASAGKKHVETNLSEDELEDFEAKWNLLWKPLLTDYAQN